MIRGGHARICKGDSQGGRAGVRSRSFPPSDAIVSPGRKTSAGHLLQNGSVRNIRGSREV